VRGLHSSGCALLVLHREGVAEEAKVAKVVVESVISDGLHVFEREDTNRVWRPLHRMREQQRLEECPGLLRCQKEVHLEAGGTGRRGVRLGRASSTLSSTISSCVCLKRAKRTLVFSVPKRRCREKCSRLK